MMIKPNHVGQGEPEMRTIILAVLGAMLFCTASLAQRSIQRLTNNLFPVNLSSNRARGAVVVEKGLCIARLATGARRERWHRNQICYRCCMAHVPWMCRAAGELETG
jgi:hypothetical protein